MKTTTKRSTSGKIFDRQSLIDTVKTWRAAGLSIAFTNGVFDLLHRGHLESLVNAAGFGDRLIVGVNSDSSVRCLGKGADRPLNTERDRAELLAALETVDAVTIFDEPTPWELLRELRPDVLVKGGDYALDEIVGREFAGRVERIQLVEGLSTTRLIEKIRAAGQS